MKNSNRTTATHSRRQFLSTTAIGAAAMFAGPAIIGAKEKEASKMIQGENGHKYELSHTWAQLPDKYKWETTHGVAVDSENNVYIMHAGDGGSKEPLPTIFAFDPNGKFIRAFGEQFYGAGHGLEIRKEGSEEFIYACAYKAIKDFAKLTLKGETVWHQNAPMESHVYSNGEDTNKKATKTRASFQPTNFTFLPDGGFLLADGYGSYYIHRFDKDAKYVSTFGGPTAGKEDGKFNCPHGLWVDNRPGKTSTLVVTDRANDRLQILDMDFKHKETMEGFGLPANIDTWKDVMIVPELRGRMTLLDSKNAVVARFGDDAERIGKDKKNSIRKMPEKWIDGKFVHPHDACFDSEGNIYVAEWAPSGRITKMKRLS